MPSQLLPCAAGVTPALASGSVIIDVERSFRLAIENYTLLDQAAFSLTNDIVSLSPQDILLRSNQLAHRQQELASQDEQLLAILAFAGPEIVSAPFIKAYQNILIKVTRTYDQMWEQIYLVKKKLLKDSTIPVKLDSLF